MFPVMLDVTSRPCLVVGGGSVALRKAHSLLEEGARVTVVAPTALGELEDLAQRGGVRLERRRYRNGEAGDYALVFAATDDPEINRQVHDDARAAGVWVNVADVPELCSFQLPARIRRGGFELAVASGGQAPFVVRRVRRLLETRFGEEWGRWLAAAARYRERVRTRWSEGAAREACYDRFFAETVDASSLAVRTPTEAEVGTWLEAGGVRDRGAEASTADGPAGFAGPPHRGFVSLVGAGPGCAGLLTLRGWRRLLEADVVVYDRLAAPALPSDLPRRIELDCVGKEPGNHPVPQDEINALLIGLARDGKRVVRFKGGDPYVFGRGSEEAEALAAAGVPFEVVPGVTAAVAVPAWAGIPLTHRREAVRVTLVTAHESTRDGAPHMRWDLAAQDPHATLVGYMGVTSLANVVKSLLESGMDPGTPAAMVERGTTAAQRRIVSSLAALPDEARRADVQPPALFVIGPTVRHAGTLDWLRGLPLAGERLAVFLAHGWDPTEALELAGADVVPVRMPIAPVVRILMTALPLTGCVLRSPADAVVLRTEAQTLRWRSDAVAWCLGRESARAARALAWARVEELDETISPPELVTRIGGRRHGLR
jgi:uroporphyrin-III C-methyltransferase/precorrin-2 dehydrogenase/sirohydrochlorin ferrochelatase